MKFQLITGTVDVTENMDGWVITSKRALVAGSEDCPLVGGDRIDFNGNVIRDGEIIANIS